MSPLTPTAAGASVLGFLACAVVVRRHAFLDAGGFSPLLHIGGEEELLAIDLRSAGWTLTYRPDVHVHHAPARGDAGRGDRRTRVMQNTVLVAVMRRPVGVAIAEVTTLTRRALNDPDARAALSGVLRRLPVALRQRGPVSQPIERELLLATSVSNYPKG